MVSSVSTTPWNLSTLLNPQFRPYLLPSTSIANPKTTLRLALCLAAKQQSGPVKKSPAANKKKKKKRGGSSGRGGGGSRGLMLDDVAIEDDEDWFGTDETEPLPLPKPPAGFVVDEFGRALVVSNKRIATIVNSADNLPLDCIIRRVFRSSRGEECMLLCPADMPIQLVKSKNVDGWLAVSDDEVGDILPTLAYALAKIHMHLVHSGFVYTARGGFAYTEDDIFEYCTDDGPGIDGSTSEGIEITCFHLDGSHYMVYTPVDPVFFIAVKDQNGQLQIADDDFMADPGVISAIDEETEFNALVEEEAALLASLLGKR